MILLNANVFLRAIALPPPELEPLHEIAVDLFRAITLGEEIATTSEAVIAEVAFILSSKTHYNLEPVEAAERLRPILALPNLLLLRGRKRRCLRALDLWAEQPRLGFVDALTAATVEGTSVRLAIFDSDFDGLPRIRRWQSAADA